MLKKGNTVPIDSSFFALIWKPLAEKWENRMKSLYIYIVVSNHTGPHNSSRLLPNKENVTTNEWNS
jgi:hypothetical protein